MSEQQPDPKNIVGSVLKAIRLLECFSGESPELSLATLAERTGLNKTTTRRLLATLEIAGWVERTEPGHYRLGLAVFRAGSSVLAGMDLREACAPAMAHLADSLGETVYLNIPDGASAVCLDRAEGQFQVRVMTLDIGRTMPLGTGGGPLAILAYNEDEHLDLVLKTFSGAVGPRAIPPEKELRAKLAEVRKQGFALSLGDVTPGVAAIGMPIFDHTGRAIAAMSLGGLAQRFNEQRRPQMVAELRAATEKVSARLGFRRPEE